MGFFFFGTPLHIFNEPLLASHTCTAYSDSICEKTKMKNEGYHFFDFSLAPQRSESTRNCLKNQKIILNFALAKEGMR